LRFLLQGKGKRIHRREERTGGGVQKRRGAEVGELTTNNVGGKKGRDNKVALTLPVVTPKKGRV